MKKLINKGTIIALCILAFQGVKVMADVTKENKEVVTNIQQDYNSLRRDVDHLSALYDNLSAISHNNEVTEPTENYVYYPLTDEEKQLVCQVVAAEARGESFEGQIAVAEVIRNRCLTWNKNIVEILTASNQFAKPYQGDIPDSVYAAVEEVFTYGKGAFPYANVTHFHADYVSPKWSTTKELVGTIGAHSFYQ